MKRWKGRWLMAVAVIHSAVAVMAFKDAFQEIAARGLFDSVGQDPILGVAVWFALFGVMLFVAGVFLDHIERISPSSLPHSLGGALLILAAIGLILMPASGFWLAIPPGLAILFRKNTSA